MPAPQNILIVEDHQDVSDWLNTLTHLAFTKVEVQQAFSLKQAILKIHEARNPIDLVLLDLSLPDGEGLSIIKDIRQHNAAVCIVVTTIFDDNNHLFEALQSGVEGYLLKGESSETLLQQLQGICNGNPPISASIARKMITHFSKIPPCEILSPREQDVLKSIGQGLTVKNTAQNLNISPNTVAEYVKSIYRKLNISSRAEAAQKAGEFNLI